MQSNHSRIAEAVIEFAKQKLGSQFGTEFYIDTLRLFVLDRTRVAPASPDRILRALRQQHRLEYTVVNRAKSLYRILSVSDSIQDETIIETTEPEVVAAVVPVAEAVAEPVAVKPRVCAVCGLLDCMYSFQSYLQTPSLPAEMAAAFAPITVVSPTDVERGRKLIADLTAFVNKDSEASASVWDIITALRGPDNGNSALKEETTQRFRFAAGFRQISSYTKSGFIATDKPLPDKVRECSAATFHFENHYNKGVRGLKSLGII